MTATELDAEMIRQRALYEYWKRWAIEEGLLNQTKPGDEHATIPSG